MKMSTWEMVSDLLHHLDIQKSMRLDGIHTGVLRELEEVLTKDFQSFIISPS